jgi:hypothetical protein
MTSTGKSREKPRPGDIYLAASALPAQTHESRPFAILGVDVSSENETEWIVSGIPGGTTDKFQMIREGKTILVESTPQGLKKDTFFFPELITTKLAIHLIRKICEIPEDKYEEIIIEVADYLGIISIFDEK